MKLAQVTNFFDEHLGGLEVVAARLAKEWSADGVTIEWLAAGTKPLATTDAPAGAFRVKKISLRAWNGIERRMGLPYPVIGPRGMAAIWRAVRAADAVVLHDTLYMSNIFAAIAGRLLRKPVLVIQHIGAVPYTSAVLRGLMAVANRMIARPVLKSASQVVFISRLAADFFANVPLRRPARFVFNGVDTAVFRPSADPQAKAQLRTALGLPRNAPVALFVGRFVEKKGITVLVRLAARMPHVTWVFAGQGVLDPQKQNLPNARVFHSLNHSELVKLYQCADVLVLPSVGEGLPLVVQEALACGLPVICGADTALADPEMTKYVRGVDVDLADVAGTALRFAAAIQNSLAIDGGDKAVEQRAAFALARYDWTVSATQYLQILQTLIAGVGPVPERPVAALSRSDSTA